MPTAELRLGLIGDSIARSEAPRLHRLAGGLSGLRVTYERLVPGDLGLGFEAVFERCATAGYRGVNVTYPYKEQAAARTAIEDPLVAAVGAVNTVIFEAAGPSGFNTDRSGFVAAYRAAFGSTPPGPVCLAGAGGVGKAIGFALLAVGLEEIRIAERDLPKAEALARALRRARPGLRASATASVEAAASGACGLVNATPVGMAGHDGMPIAAALMDGARWAFDAVYTPVETPFLRAAASAGLAVVTGWELFFHQGVEAFRIFSGRDVDQAALRAALRREAA